METAETTRDQIQASTNRAAAQRMMRAMRERDYEDMAEVLASDVVINSPITDSLQFRGRDDVLAVLRIVREAMQDLEHHDLLGSGDTWTHRFRVLVGGRLIEGMDLLRFDESGAIREVTVFVRPLPGLAAFTAAIAPEVGRRRGTLTAVVLRLLTGPLVALTRLGDRLVAWLIRGAWGAAGAK
jgi:hypothetical protein